MTNEEAAVSSASSEDEDEVAPSQLSLNVDPQDVQAAHSPDPALIGSKDGANDRYDGHKEDDEYHEDSEEFDNEDLSDSLRTEMVQSSFDRLQFLPRGALHRLVTRDSILAAMGINQPNEQDENLTEYIVKNAKAAFAIAVYIRVSRLREALALFEKFGFSDANLPIERWSKDSINDKLNPHPFVSMEGLSVKRNRRIWSWSRIYDFQEEQWKFLAPIISTAESFHDFDESIMPFINKHFDSREGAFSVVSQYEIHPDHFEDPTKSARTRDNNLFAVKAIKAEDRHGSSDHWASEVKALAKMNSLGQDHIVRFITAFRRGKKNSPEHYLVFEWADGGDLVGLWESNPQPILTASLVKAVIKQLLGLAEALDAAHYLKDENGNYSGASYRHGDLKPQNILWFRDSDGIGTLKIGDWGEAKRHNVDTELRYSTTAIYGTRRYEPPEAVIGTHEDVRSRLYDIWSIGCIYFEFLVWFLYGMKELRRFNRSTNEDLSSPSPFFQIDTKGGKRVARVHSITTHWMEQMAQDPACRIGSTALGDLLDIIERGLLVVKLPSRLGSLAFQHRPVLLQPGENDPEQGANTQEFPSINVTPSDSTGISVEPASVPELPARLRAFELRSRLALIMDNVDDDDYWFPDQSRAPNVVIPTQSSTAELFTEPVVPDSVRADYAHPRLEDDWRYEVDNEFASHVLPPPPTFTESDLPLIRVGPPLCGKCIELQNAIWRPGFTITYDTQEISENAKTMTCDLCGLLWRTCTRYSVAASQTVQLDKFCSKLRMNGMRLPVLSIFRSNGTSSLALDVQIGLVDAALALRLDLPRKWAIECDSRHANPTCKPTSNSFDTDHATVPRRLIDVGNPLQMVRLIETAGSSIGIGEWTTIDHMWGPGPQDYVTLSQNYSERTTGMRLDRLPATFRDAIRVTRSLGIQYIWIDSICIVQDDYEDRRENIQHMAAIYTNAYCVLAAGYATSAHSGFLGDRKERDYVTLAPETDFHTAFYICENIDHFEEHVLNSPLSRRAWSLQSHALARRTIFFTEYQMYWQCGHGVRCETMTKMRSNSAAFLGDPDFPKMLKSCSRAEQILRIQSLYRQYSRLKLSNATDRPLAIAGLQQRILRTMDVRGAFGILFSAEKRGILHRSLLWHRASDTSSLERISYFNTETGDVPIPSWSWMAYSGGIDYFNPDFDGYEWQDVRSPWSDNIRSDCLKAFAKDLIGLYFSLEEEHIIHDDPSEADMNGTACLVLGVEKGSTKPSAERRHYVLLVKRDPHNDWSAHAPVWKRIGAGYLPGKCLGHTIGRILVI
ncbi:hypothetical protein K458DRAFT_304318 [Lentithecium fluviatile CBS 122367]|uniref:Protein kinase domain-containing protein n=1 Tax=Lentithecium fluviatile CBS 122367 TaxID=1168545 RepID=A0A6G1IZC8_9PLEO|nr:hypothetical protein K458DRAFT_304318 [Lentithecium fluviatile CBS 122367]